MKHSWSVSGAAVMAAAFSMALPANALDLGVSVGPVSVDASVGSETSVSVGVGSDTSVGVSVGGGDSGGSSSPSEPSAPSSPTEPASPSSPGEPSAPSSPSSPEQPGAPSSPQPPSDTGGGETGSPAPQAPRQGGEQSTATTRTEVRTQTSLAPSRTVPKRASRPAKPRIDPTRALDGSRRVWAHGSETGKLESLLDLVAGCSLQDVDLRRSINDRRISIIPLDDSFGSDALVQLRTALGSPSQGRSEAVIAVRGSSMLSSVLARAGYSPDQVVALQVAKSGGADIFVLEDEDSDPGYPFAYASGPARAMSMPAVERDLCADPPPVVRAEVQPTRSAPEITTPKVAAASNAEPDAASDMAPPVSDDLLVSAEDAEELVDLLDRTERLDRLLMALNGPPASEDGVASPDVIDDIVNTSHERVRVAALPGGRNLLVAAGVEPPSIPSVQTVAAAGPDPMATPPAAAPAVPSAMGPWSSVSPYLTSLAPAPEAPVAVEEAATRVAELPPVPDMMPPENWGVDDVDETATGSIMEGNGAPDPLPPRPTGMAALPEARKEVEVDLDLPDSLSPEANAIIEEACREFAADLAEGSKDFDVHRAAQADEVEIISVPGCAPSEEVRVAFQSIFDDQPRIVAELAASGHGLEDVIGGSNNSAGVAIYVMEPVAESNR